MSQRYTADQMREIARTEFGYGDPMAAYHLLCAAAEDLEVREACTCADREPPDYSVDDLREQAQIYANWSRYRNGTIIAKMLDQAADDLDAEQCRADARRYRHLRATRTLPEAWSAAEGDSLSFADLDAHVDALCENDDET